ncbi:MAG: hypothetical protein JWP93_154, partial [Polaromonas sp.]|nr:hypothetical protein [Polaromonas sp.]
MHHRPSRTADARRGERGFTLSELILVLVVLVVLAVVITTSLSGIRRASDDHACRTQLRSLR